MSESAPSRSAATDRTTPAEGDPAPAGDDPLSRRPADTAPPPHAPEAPAAPHAPQGGPTVQLLLETADLDPPLAGWLEPMLRELAVRAGVRSGGLTVMAVDDTAMSEMHEQYAGVPGTTDVLTFDLADDPAQAADADVVEGDLVICLDEARRQAQTRGHAPRLEALLYALHGLLHLLGEDDHNEDAYQRMHAREDALLQAVGLGVVFAKGERDS